MLNEYKKKNEKKNITAPKITVPRHHVEVLASLMMVTLQGMVVLSTSTKDVASMRRARDMVVGMLESSRPKCHR